MLDSKKMENSSLGCWKGGISESSVEFLLHYISERTTLYPGDIVTTGIPRGVGTLLSEDVIEVEIEKIR